MRLLSIITVCYNSEKSIENTMKSILTQRYINFEYIVVDGRSTDNTLKIVTGYIDKFALKKIKFRVYSDIDSGIYDAMNKGIIYSESKYTLFLNSGDYLFNRNTLVNVNSFLEKLTDQPDVFYGNYCNYYNRKLYFMESEDIECITSRMPACHQSIFVKTSILKNNFFNVNYKIAADYDLMMRLYQDKKTFLKINCIISIYRIGGISSINAVRAFREFEQIKYLYGKKKNRSYNVVKYLYSVLNQALASCVIYNEYKMAKKAKRVLWVGRQLD